MRGKNMLHGKLVLVLLTIFILMAFTGAAYAKHPLITDDAETLGEKHSHIEVGSGSSFEESDESGVKVKSRESDLQVEYGTGVSKDLDVFVSVPYLWTHVEAGGANVAEDGISDISFKAKWKFYQKDQLSLAVRPTIWIPTGNESKGLGRGKVSYAGHLIATYEAGEKTAIHGNIGINHYEYKDSTGLEKNIWHVSVAGERVINDRFSLVGNIGIEKNEVKNADNDPAFLLVGCVYEVDKDVSVDIGVKFGLTNSESDIAYTAGAEWRF